VNAPNVRLYPAICMTASPSITRRPLLERAGIIILLAGLACAALLDLKARHDHALAQAAPVEEDSPLSPGDMKGYSRNAQMNGGNLFVFSDWLSRFWHDPEHLAIALATASVIASGCCFFLAARKPRA
jgi:hypothetical protein